MNFRMVDNSDKILAAFESQKKRGLMAIGEAAVGHAKEDTPVDTGRLRNSEDYAVEGNDVYIGTNVEYAPYIEFGHGNYSGVHFLKNAASNHGAEYKNIMKASLKS